MTALKEKIDERRDLSEMTLMEHLSELRTRLVHVIGSVLVTTIACYYYTTVVFDWLSGPYTVAFPNYQLIGTGPAEAFTLKITVSIFAGLIVALPYIFYQVWQFISPALHDNERPYVLPFIFVTTVCFLCGIIFCYYCVLPYSFAFFRDEYESVRLAPQIKMSEYLELTIKALIGFGVVFELPVLAFCFARFGILTHKALLSSARYVIVAIFIIAAVLTPPDVVSQMLMVAPMLVLYGVSILVVKCAEKKAAIIDPPL